MSAQSLKVGLRSPILNFLLVSVCLHAALLLSHAPMHRAVSAQSETVLSVTFNAPDRLSAPATPPAQAAAANYPAPNDNGGAVLLAAATSESLNPQDALTALPRSFNHAGTAGTGSISESARARVQARLLADLQHYFEYPLLARHRGWEGVVWLSFTVEPDGLLDRIQVAKSSGYDVLDRSAINAMQRVGQLTDAGRWLDGSALKMQLAVIFQLKDR